MYSRKARASQWIQRILVNPPQFVLKNLGGLHDVFGGLSNSMADERV